VSATHPGAAIDPSVTFGEGCVIGPGVEIGPGCRVGHHVVIHEGTRIGREVRIDDHATLGKLPMRAANSATTARKVRSGFSASRAKSQSRSLFSSSGRQPPIFFAAALPVARKRCDHFTTLATLTPNSAAVARHVRPPATEPTTRSRRSLE